MVAGGVAAPAVSAAHQLSRLGGDVGRPVVPLTSEARENAGEGPAHAPHPGGMATAIGLARRRDSPPPGFL
jgi:hypothetical protein